MRLLLVLEACGAGAGRHVIDLAGGLIRRGHDVSLIYSADRAEDWFIDALGFMPKLTKRELPMQRAVGFHDLKAIRDLQGLIDEMGPFDVVHGHSSKAGALLRIAASRGRAARVYTPHAAITMNPALRSWVRAIYGAIERLLGRYCEGIICVSALERDHLAQQGLPEEKLRVVPNGIGRLPHVDRDAVRRRLGVDRQTVCFGWVGRVSPQKSVDRIISAYAMAEARMPDTHLVIVGDGPLLASAKNQARTLGIAKHVSFTGHADGIEMMAAFDAFLLPSRYEAMPYVLLEAAASGLPIVMTNVGGAHEVVRHGENGFVLPEPDVELLADHLTALARSPELRSAMSRCSIEIGRQFDIDRMVDETVRVYEDFRAAAKTPAAVAQ
jgi:glycosyltransferase involved in cell wall biosynthesis